MFMPMISKGHRQTDTSSPSSVYWHSGLLSQSYEVVEKANEVVKCYDCGQNLANSSIQYSNQAYRSKNLRKRFKRPLHLQQRFYTSL